jgi:uncharacterized repeat protein (TIGR03843 family)
MTFQTQGEAQPGPSRLTQQEMEQAAVAGRQVAGPIDRETALRVLSQGEMTVVGRLLTASNATFFCVAEEHLPDGTPGISASCVYKPRRGERPLIDFPDGTLACREVAAHAVSEASGWRSIPPTVMRDGPFGRGMVQLWMEVDQSVDVAEIIDEDLPALRHIAVLDVILNNADRKGGHLLPLGDGRILGVDNGLTFAIEPKLRTVLWRWRGQPLGEDELEVVAHLRDCLHAELGAELRDLLAAAEVRATERRIDALLASRHFPLPDRNRPVIPWPPF